jgi:hypothetical protein
MLELIFCPILTFTLRVRSRKSASTSSHRSRSLSLALSLSSGRESMASRSLSRIVAASPGVVSLVTQISLEGEGLLVVGGGEERWRCVRSERSVRSVLSVRSF